MLHNGLIQFVGNCTGGLDRHMGMLSLKTERSLVRRKLKVTEA